MIGHTIHDLQSIISDLSSFKSLDDYAEVCISFLTFIKDAGLLRVDCQNNCGYIFYNYNIESGPIIMRPLNSRLFIENIDEFKKSYGRFIELLSILNVYKQDTINRSEAREFLDSEGICKVVYTMQQSIGCISDTFEERNRARKLTGELFEHLIRLVLREIGLLCTSRRINVPVPDYPEYKMPYQLDLVISRTDAGKLPTINTIGQHEIVGSVKTTSKDRIDKIFLDKFLLGKLFGRNVPVIAIFLHDVQRHETPTSHYLINSTFKTNHFLGYAVIFTKLDGVYYVDPRPEMTTNEKLSEQIKDFQQFLITDLRALSNI